LTAAKSGTGKLVYSGGIPPEKGFTGFTAKTAEMISYYNFGNTQMLKYKNQFKFHIPNA